MNEVIRSERADADHDRPLTVGIVAMIKGMLKRGDKQSDIAACFLINSGRVAEINRGRRGARVEAATEAELPPPGPYPSPYELWKTRQEAWRARAALEAAERAVRDALVAVHKMEQR